MQGVDGISFNSNAQYEVEWAEGQKEGHEGQLVLTSLAITSPSVLRLTTMQLPMHGRG